ncbi:O-antigen ligase family protein [Niveibacterium umoris]|uniref:O-antigen ligase n=2 Tax=Niveibacterium umoris TaxID=1193620 RepID=A0A840BVK4_9RHOO|nr:O-antigen ligase family protein [Niveibacterium umoris]MBB4014347.1 O-antigen ligase [Niveibacterium umoris]
MSASMTAAAPGLRGRVENAARWLCVAAAFSVPLPAAWISITTALFLLFWIASADYVARLRIIAGQPIAALSLTLFVWMGISVAWSPAPLRPSADDWWHYRELLLIPLMLSVITQAEWRWRVFAGFFAGFCVALLTSYLRWFKVIPDMGGVGLYAGFGGHTGFSILLAFIVCACLWLWQARPAQRALWATVGALSLFNLFFVNTGRTGQFVFLFLVPVIAHKRFGFKGIAIGAVAAALLSVGVYYASNTVRTRIDTSVSDVQQFRGGNTGTNDGVRMEFWRNSLTLIKQHPVFGGGTGSFRPEYRALAESQKLDGIHITPNPHNEYLLVWSQTGLVGLALLLALWGVQWRRAATLDPTVRYLSYALLVTMIVGDCFNSFILDNLEGHFYALLTVALAAGWPEAQGRSE